MRAQLPPSPCLAGVTRHLGWTSMRRLRYGFDLTPGTNTPLMHDGASGYCRRLIACTDQATMSSNIQRRAGSIVEVLTHRAHHQGEQLAYVFLRDGEALEEPMTYRLLGPRSPTL